MKHCDRVLSPSSMYYNNEDNKHCMAVYIAYESSCPWLLYVMDKQDIKNNNPTTYLLSNAVICLFSKQTNSSIPLTLCKKLIR